MKNVDELENQVKINDDPYGKCCVGIARKVMEYIDAGEEINPHEMICRANKKLNSGSITGYMAGAAANMISIFSDRGDDFRKAWNNYYGVDEEKAKGEVVNPAILNVEI